MAELAYHPDPRATTQTPPSREYDCDCAGGSGSGGGGSSAAQAVFSGAAAPAAPTDPTKPALFYPDGGGPIQQWDVVGQAWV